MNKFLIVALVSATLLPLVPTVAQASSSCVGSRNHVGDDENTVDPIFGGPFTVHGDGPGSPPAPLEPNCCQGPSIPLGQYYLSMRVPVATRMYHEPHVNGKLVGDARAGDVASVQADALAGIANPFDPQYELVSRGSTDVTVSQTGGFYLYEESNGQAGLQRGGTQAGLEDPCVDALAPGIMVHDTLVL